MMLPIRTNYCTVPQAAKILKVSPSTVWRWIEAGLLPAYRLGRRQILIEREALHTVIQPVPPSVRKNRRAPLSEQGRKIDAVSYPMSADAKPNQKALVGELRSFQEQMQARHGGRLLPGSSADLIRAAREERDS